MKTETFVRKSFPIQAVRVTEENMVEVAAWCGGAIKSETQGKRTVRYVEVPVHRPMSERQKKAFVGDWVSFIGRSFKSYTQRAFDDCFEKPSEEKPVTALPLEFLKGVEDSGLVCGMENAAHTTLCLFEPLHKGRHSWQTEQEEMLVGLDMLVAKHAPGQV